MSTKGAYNLQNQEIMKREQIIKIMQKGFEEMACREASKSELNYFKESADAILAIPLEVPSDEEIAKKIQLFRKNKLDGYGNMSIGRLQLGELEWSNLVLDISKWMRDEIIKRNK